MRYATSDTRETIADPHNGWGEIQVGSVDLFRFSTAKERDSFVSSSIDRRVISSVDARNNHKEQFRFWGDL